MIRIRSNLPVILMEETRKRSLIKILYDLKIKYVNQRDYNF